MPEPLNEKERQQKLEEGANRRERRAKSKLEKQGEAIRKKKLAEITHRIDISSAQAVAGIKMLSFSKRFKLCWEILWRLRNKEFNEFGEYIGKKTGKLALSEKYRKEIILEFKERAVNGDFK